jgi:hypothetical protein
MGEQVVQCIACLRIKNAEGSWISRPFQKPGTQISHTYCKTCIQSLQKKFFAARDFKNWEFTKQVNYLSNELDKQGKKYDDKSFRTYLEEFYCISRKSAMTYSKALKHKLVPSVCACCHEELTDEAPQMDLNELHLHSHCYREISWKIRIIQESGWDCSDKLDAYFDLLRIGKSLRSAVKTRLKNLREKADIAV